jgi:hypothetical protein
VTFAAPGSGTISDPALATKLEALIGEGWEIWERFDLEVRQRSWHPFVAADYERVLQALLPLRSQGLRFLEWGSATGVITVMADLLGFDAYGIELDPALVRIALDLAARYESSARFAAGSFIPAGYEWRSSTGDPRRGTIGDGASAYPAIGHPLEDFDLVYAYPWRGEEPMMIDLVRTYGRGGARLLLHGGPGGIRVETIGRSVS